MQAYRIQEDSLMKVIAQKFNLKYPFPEKVKRADQEALKFEWSALMENPIADYCWSIRMSKMKFLHRFEQIMQDSIAL